MELICYLHPGWAPLIRPAPATRAWMDATPESFAYRCLPLNIANAHGWEVLCPVGFEAVWDGGSGVEAVALRLDAPAAGKPEARAPVSLFGQGVLTFHIEGIFRTPPGWNLMVGGSPNRPKDAIAPLSGIIETDWSPFTFTMNWRFTRPHHPVRFEALEPIGFLFPVQRSAIEAFAPRFADLGADPALMAQFTDWSRARDAFHEKMRRNPPKAAADKWQKHYYRGVDAGGTARIDDHRAKLRLKPFAGRPLPPEPARSAAPPPVTQPPEPTPSHARVLRDLRRREWLMEAQERQRHLSPVAAAIERRSALSSDEFLDRYYAPGRPVILLGEMADWPALARWTPEYMARTVGPQPVEFQGGRSGDARYEQNMANHKRIAPFDAFIHAITRPGAGNDAYLTASNALANAAALSALDPDLGFPAKFLDPTAPAAKGMIWIGPEGTVTPLHHDLTNNLIAQVVGRKRLLIAPAAEVGRLHNDVHVYSQIIDLERPAVDLGRLGRLEGAHIYEVMLAPGEMIFMPLGWWHQVESQRFSVTLTYTNFLWPNDAAGTFPED